MKSVDNQTLDVAIIGAGFAGLGAAIRLQQAGYESFVIFERAAEVGGTWRDNVYPGCACDVPSHLYSFSFEPNPNWSRMFSPQPEILAYLKSCVNKYKLQEKIQFNTEVQVCRFDEQSGYWTLQTSAAELVQARVVVSAIGPLNRPNIPQFKGLSNFKGAVFHSSQWNQHESLHHKRVAVIGTGASAIQIIPSIAPDVQKLVVFQRTAPWVAPRPDRMASAFEKKLFRQFPFLQWSLRSLIYWILELRGTGLLGNRWIHALNKKISLNHIKESIQDPKLQQKVIPTYEYGCKRIVISSDYYPALSRQNVQLVTDSISEISENSILTANGVEYPVDVIVLSTGFVAAEINVNQQIFGLGGRELIQEWREKGAQAYLGTAVSGFPNLFFLVGPNSGIGHNSIIHIIESQVNYVVDYLKTLKNRQDGAYMNLRLGVQEVYNQQLQHDLKDTVWASGCQSWYLTATGKNTTIWPHLNSKLRHMTKRVKLSDFDLVKY
ncbi:MAG: NAD(P)/FAD-dependent oxidoreductase [Spirosomataceae bacterium]